MLVLFCFVLLSRGMSGRRCPPRCAASLLLSVPVPVLLREVFAGEARAVLLSMGHRLLLLLLDKSQRGEHYIFCVTASFVFLLVDGPCWR